MEMFDWLDDLSEKNLLKVVKTLERVNLVYNQLNLILATDIFFNLQLYSFLTTQNALFVKLIKITNVQQYFNTILPII